MAKKIIITIITCVTTIGLYIGIHLFAYLTTNPLDHLHKESLIIVGHRGAEGLAPENSLMAIQKAIDYNTDYIEIDIQRTKDNVLVVCHDPTIDRTTSGKGRIIDQTWSEISIYKVIPKLEDVFLLMQKYPQSQLIIEIKEGSEYYPDIEEETLELIKSYNLEERIIVQSFKDKILTKVHAINPKIRIQKLFWFKLIGIPFIIDTKLTYFSTEKYSYVNGFNVWYNGLFPSAAKLYKKMGKELKTYTLHEKEMPQRLDKHIDGVITNHPDWWKRKDNQ